MRPGQEELRRDAVEKVAEFQPHVIRGRSGLLRESLSADRGFHRSRCAGRLGLIVLRFGHGDLVRFGLSLETVEETHALDWALRILAEDRFP